MQIYVIRMCHYPLLLNAHSNVYNIRIHIRMPMPNIWESFMWGKCRDGFNYVKMQNPKKKKNYNCNRPYSRRGHDGQKERLGLQIYRTFARQYVNCDVTSLLLHVPVT